MKLVIISSDGIGAGKTTLAHKLSPNVYSLADRIRDELNTEFPFADFFDKSQAGKQVVVKDGKTVRDMLIERGMEKRAADPDHWVKSLVNLISVGDNSTDVVVVDDIRFVNEVVYFREHCREVTHIHLCYKNAVHEPQYENAQLLGIADYTVTRL